MDLGRGLRGPDGSRAPTRPINPGRQSGLSRGFRALRLSDGEAESGEGSVAVRIGAVEFLSKRTVEVEAGASEGTEGPAVAPIEGEEAAGFSGGSASHGRFLDEGYRSAAFG